MCNFTRSWRVGGVLTIVLSLVALHAELAHALPRTWIGGNVNWDDDGSTANWTPADEPDADDEAIFNTVNTVNLGTNNSIVALTMSAGIDLNTNDFDLTVNGLVQLVNAGTNLIVGGSTSTLVADSVTINNGGDVQMAGGQLTVVEETGNGLLDVNAGGTLSGHGSVSLTDGLAVVTSLLSNDGTISASHPGPTIFIAPIVDTLLITASDVDARINLDGTSENGVVNVNRNQTLDINVALADAFSGAINLFQNSTLDISNAWTLDSGTITANNGFIDNVFPTPDVPAGTSTIAGGPLTQTGGTITVVDTDGTLQFNAGYQMNGGTLTNNGLVIFNEDATIAAAANFVMAGIEADLVVEATVNINQTNFNLDANGTSLSTITVNSFGELNINVSDYDTDATTNAYNGVLTLNTSTILIFTGDAEFVMDGTLNMNASTIFLSRWVGEPLDVGDDAGALDAQLNVGGGFSEISSQTDFNSDANVSVAAGATLGFNSVTTVNFDTVNGANSAQFTGAGSIVFSGPVNVNEAVTLNMVGGAVDLDGQDNVGDFINIDAPLVINAATMSSFGRVPGGGINTLDVNNSAGTGVLTVNLDSAASEWTLNAAGVMNLVNDNSLATLLAGSDVNINGTVNVTGDVRTTARLDIGSTGVVNINTVAQPFRLAGGSVGDPNTLAGGTINGPGELGGDTGINLRGFGTINATIDFDGTSDLKAAGGTLTVNGTINDVDAVGTADATGVLNIPAAWETDGGPGNTIGTVALLGGTLQGGTITNDNPNGINGFGTIASRVINDTSIDAQDGGTLIVQTIANNNDWDGTTNTGQLNAISGNLEVRDNALFSFLGSSQIFGNRELFINGFDLRYVAGSSIAFSAGSRLRGTTSTDFGGTITVAAGAPAEIQYPTPFFFAPTSNVTITGTLRVANTLTTINAGAVFSGDGTLLNPAGSALRLVNNADVDALIQNQGTMDLGDGAIPNAQVTGLDFQQDATGSLAITLGGTGLAQFDRLDFAGAAQLAGLLNVSLQGGFVPALGDTFTFLTAAAGRSGTFSNYDLPSIGLVNSLAVIYGANNVTLQVIAGPRGDYNGNGVVDAADYIVWRKMFGTGVAAFSGADGSGDGFVNQADYDVWRGNFGNILGAGSGAAVPEPATLVMLMFAAAGWCLRQRRAA